MNIIDKSLAIFTAFFILVVGRGQLLPIVDDSHDGSTNSSTGIQTYIVHVQKPNGTEFLRFKDRKDWYMSFLPNATLDSGEPRMLFAYRVVICGFAARLTHKEAKAMESMEGFLQAYPEKVYYAETTYTPEYLGLNQYADGLWNPTSFGDGVIIGVVDTGIKPTHPSFLDSLRPPMTPPPAKFTGNCHWGHPICNNKLIGAVGVQRGRYNSPLDNDGHGTHCASTAAGSFVQGASVLDMGSGTASGMAPRAHLAMYKVLWKNSKGQSTGTDSDILAGIEQAIRDPVDVLSMSLGATKLPLDQTAVSVGSFAAMTRGIVPVAAAGNNGPFPSDIANDAPWVLTVGASSIGRRIRTTVRLGDGREFDGESAYQPDGYNSPMLPLVYPGASRVDDDRACDGSMLGVRGSIVLCEMGLIGGVKKGENVKRAGGSGMVLLNPPTGGKTTSADPHVLPAAHVGNKDAWEILQYCKNTANPTAAIVFKGTQFGGLAPAVAAFSSRGPSLMNGGILKPDIVAPGENILAAWPFEVGPNPTGTAKTFKFLSGTSMATPHVAGIAALLKNMHPNWSPAAIKSAMMTTATNEDNTGGPMSDEYSSYANVYAQGSGHVNPSAAIDPGLVYDIEYYHYIHYLCGAGFHNRQISSIAGVSVDCANVKAIIPENLNYPSVSVSLGPSSPTKRVTRTLTNVDETGKKEIYQVTVHEPTGVAINVSPTTLQFQSVGEKKSYTMTLIFTGKSPSPYPTGVGKVIWSSGKHSVKATIVVPFTK